MSDLRDQWPDLECTIVPGTSAYLAGDVIGNAAAPLATGLATGVLLFTAPTNKAGGGIVNMAVVSDDEGKAVPGTLWLFKDNPTTQLADNAPFVLTSFDDISTKYGMQILLPSYTSNGALYRVAEQVDINNKILFSNINRIYGYFVCSSGVTFTAAHHMYFRLGTAAVQ